MTACKQQGVWVSDKLTLTVCVRSLRREREREGQRERERSAQGGSGLAVVMVVTVLILQLFSPFIQYGLEYSHIIFMFLAFFI